MKFIKLFAPILIATFLILSDYKLSYLNNFRQSVSTLISPIYLLVDFTSQLYLWVNDQGISKEYLLKQNRNLNNELIMLKAKLQTYNTLILKNKKLTALLDASYTIKEQKFTLANVISISQSRLKKQIIINKGSNDKLELGQVVIGVAGVIGQITQIAPFYSTILMITDPTQHVPVKNKRNGIRGISNGIAAKQNKLKVNFIKSEADIKLGDIFLTSGIGSKFPPNYPVGKAINIVKHNEFLYIQLSPIQNTDKLEFVLIINHKL